MRFSINNFGLAKVIFVVLFAIPLLGCDLIVKHKVREIKADDSVRYISNHIDFYAKRLQIGMPREKVLSYLPAPQNTNSENVCVWVSKSTETVVTKRYDWQWLQTTRGGYFLIFVDNKLATPLCANAAFDPQSALEYYAGMNSDQIQQVLGTSNK